MTITWPHYQLHARAAKLHYTKAPKKVNYLQLTDLGSPLPFLVRTAKIFKGSKGTFDLTATKMRCGQ